MKGSIKNKGNFLCYIAYSPLLQEFKRFNPARDEVYISLLLIILSIMQIDFAQIHVWPNFFFALIVALSASQIFFICKSLNPKSDRWDRYRYRGSVAIVVSVLLYVGIAYETEQTSVVVVFLVTSLVALVCAIQNYRATKEIDHEEEVVAQSGEVVVAT